MPTPTRKPPHSAQSGIVRLAASTALAAGTAAFLLAGATAASAADADAVVVGPLPDSDPPQYYHYGTDPDPIALTPGQSFTISGPENLWTTGPNNDMVGTTPWSQLGQCGKDGEIRTVELDTTTNSDGSLLTVSVPTRLPNVYWGLSTIPFTAINAQEGGPTTVWLDAGSTIDLSAATPTVTFTQDPSDATKITISIYNVHSYESEYAIGITNPDDLGILTIAPGDTGTTTVTAPVGSEIWIGGFGCPEAVYTVPAGPTATPTPDAPSGSLSATTVGQDHSLTVNGAGFEANEPIQIWLHSTPIQLWSGTASATGTISQSVVIPASVPTGAHQIEIRGADSGSVWLDLTVTQMLPATGLDATSTIVLAAGAVATLGAGTVLTITSARRRRARA